MPLTSAIDNAVIGVRNAERVIEDSARKIASVPVTTPPAPSPTLPQDNVEYSENVSSVYTVQANAVKEFSERGFAVNPREAPSSSSAGDSFNTQEITDETVEYAEEVVRQQQAFTQIKANLALIEKTEDMLGTLADISS